MNDYRY